MALADLRVEGHAGIDHDNIEAVELLGAAPDHPGDGVVVGDIEGCQDDLGAVPARSAPRRSSSSCLRPVRASR